MKKSKGFTLIELLAVIVILALLVLVAVPAITNIIQNSTKNSFKNEVNALVKNMQNAYTDKMNEKIATTFSDDAKIHTISIGTGENKVTYSYLCMTLEQLVLDQYTQKNNTNAIAGYIQIFVPNTKGKPQKTVVNMSDGRFFYQGELNDLKDVVPSLNKVEGDNALTEPTFGSDGKNATKCPGSAPTAFPTKATTN